jgi:hypothetical protein
MMVIIRKEISHDGHHVNSAMAMAETIDRQPVADSPPPGTARRRAWSRIAADRCVRIGRAAEPA